MSNEIKIEQIERAIKGEGIEHPVIRLFDKYSDHFDKFFSGYAATDILKRAEYARANMGFLEEGVLNIEALDFSPIELVAMWGRLFQEMDKKIPLKGENCGNETTKNPGYELAHYLVHAYASEGLPQARRMGVKERMKSMFLEGLFETADEVDRYEKRLDGIRTRVEEINAYTHMFGENSFQRQFLYNVAENINQRRGSMNLRLETAREAITPK